MPPYESDVPLGKVMELRSRGTPNNQIIQILQNEGHSSDQIFDAMNQADMHQNVGQGIAEPNIPPERMENPMQMQPQGYGQFEPQQQQNQPAPQEYMQHIQQLSNLNEKLSQRIEKLEHEFSSLQQNFDKLHQAIIGKIGEYDQNILNVGTEIKAMEKVFQKILPTFTENVNELSRLTQKLKK